MERVWVAMKDTKDRSVKIVSEPFFFNITQSIKIYIFYTLLVYNHEVLNSLSNLELIIIEIIVDIKTGYEHHIPIKYQRNEGILIHSSIAYLYKRNKMLSEMK